MTESLDLVDPGRGLKPHLEYHWFKLLKLIVDAEQYISACCNYSLLLGSSALFKFLHFI